jgi:hypothetical protein
MLKTGYISEEEFDRASDAPLFFREDSPIYLNDHS